MHEVEEKRELAKQASGGGEVLKGDEVCIDTGFPQALEIMENLEKHEKKFHPWKNHGI